MQSKTDEQLMLDYAAGNSAAFNELFRRYGKKLYNLFLRSLKDVEPAQDLLQECFIRVIESRDRYQPKKAFSNWIFTIAMNLIRDKYRQHSRRKMESISDKVVKAKIETGFYEDSETKLETIQIQDAVANAVHALPEEQRQIILLSKYDGFSFAEIADILHLSPAAAKQKAYRAMQNLRKKLTHLREE